jgi:hypothetical protein
LHFASLLYICTCNLKAKLPNSIHKMELRGKTILITVGSAGIGLEAAKQFLALGAKVLYVMNRFFPKLAFKLVNPKKAESFLQQ